MRKSWGFNHAETWQERLAQAVQGFGLWRTHQHLGKVHELETGGRLALARAGGPRLRAELGRARPGRHLQRLGLVWHQPWRGDRTGFLIHPAALTGF